MTARVAVPSKGRLRDEVVRLLTDAGYAVSGLRGRGSAARLEGLELIEMRPKDAAAALAAEALDGAFIATDIALEYGVDALPSRELGFARSDLIVAGRDEDGHGSLADLAGAVVATHMPNLTQRHFDQAGVEVRVMAMGGSLEGVCAAGIADAIVDNAETGTSLRQNHLSQIDLIATCQAEFVHRPGLDVLADLELRLEAVLAARRHRYVMLHLSESQVPALVELFHGLESPTVLPLAGRDDLVAVHFVAKTGELWQRLAELRTLGATGIVALPTGALLP
jgi:ATP phosphoribosyltransferase